MLSIYRNIEGLYDILGIKRDVIKSGKYADLTSTTKGLNNDEKQILKQHQDYFHTIFITYLMENRKKLNYQEAFELSQGQLILGRDARELNLIDEIGNFNDTINALARDIKLKNPELIYFRPKTPSLHQILPFNI